MIVTCISISNIIAVDKSMISDDNVSILSLDSEDDISSQSSTTLDSSKREININEGWKFYLGTSSTAQNRDFNDSSWDDVDLPHDFSITQNFTTSGEAESGFLPGGTGWYRKSLILDSGYANKSIIIDFDGVYSDAYIYINGTYVGEHHYGYTNFAFDISDYLTCDGTTENVIAVKAVNNIPSSRWYSGSGIYRDVNLIITNSVHVDYNGTYVTTPKIENNDGTVNIQVDIKNDSSTAENVTVKNTVYTSGGEKASDSVETTINVEGESTATTELNCVVTSPELWSIDNPNLYYVRTELIQDNTVIDTYDTIFGFRYFSFDSSGFHLNGENIKLNGVCMHHDQGALGSAAYYDAMYKQLETMKDMGVNAIRTSHNPADRDFIEICNELGLVVIEESFDGWVDAKNGNSNDFSKYFETRISDDNQLINKSSDMTWSEYAMKSLVKRDRNNPSIIAWSICNEIQEGTSLANVSRYDDIADNLIGYINSLDTTRPVTSGDNNRGSSSDLVNLINTITESGGIAGFNYANSTSSLSSLAQSFGGNTGCIIASETSSHVNSRGIYTSQSSASDADGKYHLTSYDTSCVSWGITAHQSIYNTYQYDNVAGEFVWTGYDYIGEPTPWNGTGSGSVSGSGAMPNSSYFGMVDTAGFEKDTYYLYRSQWNKKSTTLHLVTAWDSDNMMTSSGKTPVWVYSNAPTVKLYRNGDLVGTAIRKAVTSDAGHTYYTYTTESNDSSVCTTTSGSGAEALYAVFNVTYESGTISAIAYDENGNEIKETTGNSSVSTPDSPSRLNVTVDKKVITNDGQSLLYVEVEVVDSNGYLDTTATNKIKFNLNGNGEILGVDNGDQATTDKYQQSSVLTNSKEANIDAYAGKALVIVRSTADADESCSFTLGITSDGLTSSGVIVSDNQVSIGNTTLNYTRNYSVKVGNQPTLDTSITKTVDDTVINGTIQWNDLSNYIKAEGQYEITGTAIFNDNTSIEVSGYLKVIGDVIAMRNISLVTKPNTIPTLPTTVKGLFADGSLSQFDYEVDWEDEDLTENQFSNIGDIIVVNGKATIIDGETLPVTASIRVGEVVSGESTNIASQVLTLTQDIEESNQSDNLSSIINGTTNPGDNTSERWTNWGNRKTSETATLTFTWATAHLLDKINLCYYYDNCCSYPENIKFEYSLDGTNFKTIDVTAKKEETYSLGAKYCYEFNNVINPIALRITFTQQNGTSGSNCVGLTEVEIMTASDSVLSNSEAYLSSISVDGDTVENFESNILSYAVSGSEVSATTDKNVGITILPEYEGVVRIVTISEDGESTTTYEITLSHDCQHQKTEVRNTVDATCTDEGYTGDTYCSDCGELIEQGKTISAKGHSWNDGVVTLEPTVDSEGVKTYTCTVCQTTKTESIDKLTATLLKPSVSIIAEAVSSTGKIKLTGTYLDYENNSKYCEVIEHGIVYCYASKLGTRTLTVNTAGRTKVKFSSYKDDGTFIYTMTPAYASTKYVVRSYLYYKDNNGTYKYVYSDPIRVSYNSLNQ